MPTSSINDPMLVAKNLCAAVRAENLAEVTRLAQTFTAWAQPDASADMPCPARAVIDHFKGMDEAVRGLPFMQALLAPMPPRALVHRPDLLLDTIRWDSFVLAQALLPFCDPQQVPSRQWFALGIAASKASPEATVLLDALLAVCDPNMTNGHGDTALMYAAQDNRVDNVARLLAQPGLSLNQVDEQGRTALHRTADTAKGQVLTGHGTAAMKRLLSAGIDPNLQDRQGRTALMTAIVRNQPWLIKVLLDHHDQRTNGATPLDLLLRDQDGYRADDLARMLNIMPGVCRRLEKACQAQERARLLESLDEADVSGTSNPSTSRRSRARL